MNTVNDGLEREQRLEGYMLYVLPHSCHKPTALADNELSFSVTAGALLPVSELALGCSMPTLSVMLVV